MLETPKKKTGIWQAISEDLKDFNVDVCIFLCIV